MKAAQIDEYGDASEIVVREVNMPAASSGQVVVEVHASSLNPFDTAVRVGRVQAMIKQLPVTLGGDIAGVVTAVGNSTGGVAVGDRVWGQANAVAGNSGAWAEFAATAAGQVGKMPDNLDFEQAGSMPLVGVSALQALTQHLQVAAGDKVFIHGGAGGIGSAAIQIAKHLGANVTTTATGDDVAYVKQLGADEVIDYKKQNFAQMEGFDAAFDTVGGDDFNKVVGVVKRGGRAVSMTASADVARAAELGVTAQTQGTKVTTAMLDELAKLVELGVVKPQVAVTFPLEKAAEAMRARESGHTRGKIVLSIS